MLDATEYWLPVVGWEGLYEVSDQGRVRSVDRTVAFGTRTRRVHARVLKPGRTIHGVLFVNLSGNGIKELNRVHRLVLQAFVGPCPQGMEGCHANDEHEDNRLINLRWDTHSANMYDKVRNGGCHQTKKTHCPNGHEYTPNNTRIGRNGGRWCRECHGAQGRDAYWRNIENQRRIKRDAQRVRRARLKQQLMVG